MANDTGKKIKTTRNVGNGEALVPSKNETTIMGGIDKIVNYITDDIFVGFNALITGDVSVVQPGKLKDKLRKGNTVFDYLVGKDSIKSYVEDIKHTVETIKQIFDSNNNTTILYNVFSLLSEINGKIDLLSSTGKSNEKPVNVKVATKGNDYSDLLDNIITQFQDFTNYFMSNFQNEYLNSQYSGILEKISTGIEAPLNTIDKNISNSIEKMLYNFDRLSVRIDKVIETATNKSVEIKPIDENTVTVDLSSITDYTESLKKITNYVGQIQETLSDIPKVSDIESGVSKIVESLSSLKSISESLAKASDQKSKDELFKILNEIKNKKQYVNNVITNAPTTTDSNEILKPVIEIILDTSKAPNLEDIFSEMIAIGTTQDDILNNIYNIENIFIALNALADEKGIMVTAIDNVNKIPSKIEQLNKDLESINTLFFTLSTLNVAADKYDFSAFKSLSEILKNIDNLIIADDKTTESINKKIDSIKESLQKIQDLYANDIAITSKMISDHDKDIQNIKDSTEKTKDIATSASKIDEKELEKSMTNISDIIDSITMMGIAMLIGGHFINKNPKLIEGSLKFGATLAVFLVELMIPIALITLITSKKETKADISSMMGMIAAMGAIMVIGAFIVKSNDIMIPAMKFGIMLGVFLLTLMPAIFLMSKVTKKETFSNLAQVNRVVIMSAIVMILGSFFVNSIDVKNALKFGVVLGLFMLSIMTPFILYAAFSREQKEADKTIATVKGVIIMSAALMLLGALVVKNKELVTNALKFGVVLGLFIAMTMAPLILFSLITIKTDSILKHILLYIVTCTIIMSIGALLVKNEEFVKNAITFGALLMAFITATLLPILVFKLLSRQLVPTIAMVLGYITAISFIMMVGALFIRDKELVNDIIAFGGLIAAFIVATTAPMLLNRAKVTNAMSGLKDLAVFILAVGITFGIAAYVVNKFGWLNSIGGIALIAACLIGMMQLVKIFGGDGFKLGKTKIPGAGKGIGKPQINNALMILGGISAIMLLTSVSLLILNKVRGDSLLKLAGLGLIIAGMMGIIKLFNGTEFKIGEHTIKTGKGLTITNIRNALILIGGITAAFLALSITMLLLNFVKGDSFIKLGVLTAIVTGMIFMIKGINSSIKKEEVANAAIILGAISGVLLMVSLSMLILSIVNDKSLYRVLVASIIVCQLVAMTNLIDNTVSKEKAINAGIIMGILSGVLLTVSLSLLILSAVNDKSLYRVLIAETVVLGMAGIAVLINRTIKKKDAIQASVVLGALAGTLLAVSIAMLILNKVEDKSLYKIIVAELAVLGIAGIAILVNKTMTKKDAIQASIVLGALAGTLLAVSIAMLILNKVEDKSLYKIVVAELAVLGIAGIAILINKTMTKRDAIQASIVLGVITGILFGVATAMLILNKVEDKSLYKIAVAELAVLGIAGIAILINKTMTKKDATKAAVILGVLTAVLLGVTFAMLLLNKIEDPKRLLATVGIMTLIIGEIVALCAVAALASSTGVLWVGIGAIAAISGIILVLSGAMLMIAKATETAEKIKNPGAIKDVFNSFIKAVTGIKALDIVKLTLKAFALTAAIIPAAIAISTAGKTLRDFASLKIATAWDKGGKPTAYEILKQEDLKNAASNISTIISTLAEGIQLASTHIDKMSRKSLRRTLDFSRELGSVIGSIATGVQSYAKLMIPTTYNADGSVKSARLMSKTEFKDAAENIKEIIMTLGIAIADIASGKPVMVDGREIATQDFIDLLNSSKKKKNPYYKVLDASTKLGELISNIAMGISSFANMVVPDKWNNDGKPVHYRALTDPEIKSAIANIKTIITTMTEPIKELAASEYASLFESVIVNKGNIFKKTQVLDSPFIQVLQGALLLGEVISSLAAGIQDMANLKFAIEYDEKGNAKKWVSIKNGDFTLISENIKKILNASVSGIISAAPTVNVAAAKEAIEAIQPVGEMISNTANGITALANLMIPTEWDKNGKAIKFKQMEKQDFIDLGDSISEILTATTNALVTAYVTNKDKFDKKKFKEISDAFTPVSDLIGKLGESIAKFAQNTVKVDGKDVPITTDMITKADENIDELLTTVLDSIIDVYTNKNYKDYFVETNGVTPLSKISTTINDILDITANMVEALNGIAGLKNLDTSLQNIGKIYHKDTGIIKTILDAFANTNITAETNSTVDEYSSFVQKSGILLENTLTFVQKINEKKELIDAVVSYKAKNSKYTENGVFSDILFLFESVTLTPSNIDVESMKKLINDKNVIMNYMKLYDELMKTVTVDMALYYPAVELIYTSYFSGSKTVVDKMQEIVTAINSFADSILKTTGKSFLGSISDKLGEKEIFRNIRAIRRFIFKVINNVVVPGNMLNAMFDKNMLTNLFSDVDTVITSFQTSMKTLVSDESLSNRQLNNIFVKVRKIKEIFTELSQISFISLFKESSEDNELIDSETGKSKFDIVLDSINRLSESTDKSRNGAKNLKESANALDKFVKTVDKVNIDKADSLANAMNALANLAEKIGGFEKLIEALNGEFANVLFELSEKIDNTNKTIAEAKEFEAAKKDDLEKKLGEFKDVMNKPMTINVGKLNDDGTVAAAYEQQK